MSRNSAGAPKRATARTLGAFAAITFGLGIGLMSLSSAAFAQESQPADTTVAEATPAAATEESAVDDATLRAGAQVYSQICSSCHQPGGAGLSGQYPPLKGNPNVADTEYVRGVIHNGRTGELVVDGVTYNGVMPPQTALTEDDVTNVIAYIQSGFQAPAAGAVIGNTGPVAGTQLPALSNMTWVVAMLIAAGGFLFVLGPRITSAHDGATMPWLDAWLKTAIIVIGLIVFTVFVPSRVLETETVAKLDRPIQDLIASGLWVGGLAAGLWALWYTQRDRRI
ncbi:MAG: cytochrome c [Ilumatobacteraceae bacterium]